MLQKQAAAAAALAVALSAGAAKADIPPPPISENERANLLAAQARSAGHACPRVLRHVRWSGRYAARLEARELEPWVVQCQGGALLVIADAPRGWREYPHAGAPYPGEQPRPRPQLFVWRFR